MIDESKASVLSDAQFRSQLDWLINHCLSGGPFDVNAEKDQLVQAYAEARQASAWQPIVAQLRELARYGSDCGGIESDLTLGEIVRDLTVLADSLAPHVLEDDAHER